MNQTALDQIQLLNHSSIPPPSLFTPSQLTPRSIHLTWEPIPLSTPPISQYLIFLWLLNARFYTNYSVFNDTAYQVKHLQPYTHYQTALTGLTQEGNFTQFTPPLSFRTNESAPSSFPNLTIVSVSSNSILLNWLPLPRTQWRGAPYQYKITWFMTGTTHKFDEYLPYDYTSYEITGLQNGAEYTIHVIALTEFGGEGSSPTYSATTTTSYLPDSALQYIAVPVIIVLGFCCAIMTYVFKRIFCQFQGLSASWFKRQKKTYQLLSMSEVKLDTNTNARQSPLLLRNTRAPTYIPQSAQRTFESNPTYNPLDSQTKARSAVTLHSDGSFAQLPTPIRPVSAVPLHTTLNIISTGSSVRDSRHDNKMTNLAPASVHNIASSSSDNTEKGLPSLPHLTETRKVSTSEEKFNLHDIR